MPRLTEVAHGPNLPVLFLPLDFEVNDRGSLITLATPDDLREAGILPRTKNQ